MSRDPHPWRLTCPKCGAPCEAEFVDIGVGEQQCTPWECPGCHWVQETPEIDDIIMDLIDKEEGW